MSKHNPRTAMLGSEYLPVTQDVAGSSPVRPATSHKWSPLEPEGFPSFEPEGFFVSSNANFQLRLSKVRRKTAKVGHKVGHVQVEFLGVPEAARLLKVSPKSVTRWCESGKLPAIALGMEACTQGKRVAFYTAAELVNLLLEAQAQYRLSRVEHRLNQLDLLIVDELGYLALDSNGVKLLFSVFAARYERKATIVTTNLPFEQWETIFTDPAMTAALVDRLTHHCHLLEMNGDSYRFKEGLRRKQSQ